EIIVEEKPIIDKILFKGNTIFAANKLKSAMKVKENDILNHSALTQDMVEIRTQYEKKGYQMVEVIYGVNVDKATNRAVVTVTVDEKIRVKVVKITITGNKNIKTGRLVKVLGTKPAWLFNAGAFQDDTFKEDLERIKALYGDEGYLDAQPVPKIDYSGDGKLMYITIDIQEGKKYLAGDISFKGRLLYPEKEIRNQLKMVSGKAFSTRALREDVFNVRQYYTTRGYMKAEVNVARNLNPQTGNIDLTYEVEPKEITYVGKIDIKGNIKTKDIVIRRELRIYPGERYDGDKMRKSKERLYNLGFFEDLYFDTQPTKEENIEDLIVDVKESKTGEFSFGGGYSTVDMLVGFVEVSQRNFDIMNFPTFMGAGQDLTIKAEIGMIRQNYVVSWTDPWVLGFPFSFGFDIYRTSHSRKTNVGYGYEEIRTGGDLRLGKDFTDEIRGDMTYRLEEVKISDVADNASQDLKNETGRNWISSLLWGAVYDTRDNIYTPTRGWLVTGNFEDAGGIIGGDKNYIKATGGVAYYHLFFEKLVLELKARTGIAAPYGNSDEVPIYGRFFTGGAETIRGYGERKVSPRDPGSDDPIGGEAMLVGNAEVTFPIYEKILKGSVFYDVGNTWRRHGDYMNGGLKSGAGVGLRIKTPIGPVKLDYGYPLSSNYDDKREGQFYFSMSRGF
ncbi:MAG: outer membrane protein assembly factor BamA, partial [Candidatus Omnitrophica bacterium]|nr:outer membrane protein assembly factor BamA [Candidatus Omnitrophota bacterium]